MTSVLGLLQASALVVAGSAALTALALATIYPAARALVLGLPPAERARVLLGWIAAPVAVGLSLIAVCFLPSVASVLGIGADHCLRHADHHVHLCLVHRPAPDRGAIGWITAGVVVAIVFGVAHRLRDIVRSSHTISSLLRLARYDRERGVHVVESDQPVSFAAGTRRPAICVSSRMLEAVSERFVAVVLEHERAHVRRRDPLRLQLASLLSAAHVPAARRPLLSDIALACEQACDEAAANRSEDRLDVARAILAVERLFPRSRAGMDLAFSSFGGGDITARVEWLLADLPATQHSRRWVWLIGAFASAVFLNAYLHHLTETLLGHLLR